MKYTYVALLSILLIGCGQSNKFEQEITQPEWFDSIDAPEINSSNEVSALWQSKKRCCEDETVLLKNNRTFYKSCYNAISENFDNEELVVKCLWLMDAGANSKQKIKLSKFLVENYSHHKNSITGCANCMPADTVARETLSFARYEKRLGHQENAIHVIENLLDNRLSEISYWVQVQIYEFLGRLYLEQGITDTRIKRFKETYKTLNRVKDYNEPLERRYKSFEKVYMLVIDQQPQ
jgi:hypothetical protein